MERPAGAPPVCCECHILQHVPTRCIFVVRMCGFTRYAHNGDPIMTSIDTLPTPLNVADAFYSATVMDGLWPTERGNSQEFMKGAMFHWLTVKTNGQVEPDTLIDIVDVAFPIFYATL